MYEEFGLHTTGTHRICRCRFSPLRLLKQMLRVGLESFAHFIPFQPLPELGVDEIGALLAALRLCQRNMAAKHILDLQLNQVFDADTNIDAHNIQYIFWFSHVERRILALDSNNSIPIGLYCITEETKKLPLLKALCFLNNISCYPVHIQKAEPNMMRYSQHHNNNQLQCEYNLIFRFWGH